METKNESRLEILNRLSKQWGTEFNIETFEQFSAEYNHEAVLNLVYIAMREYAGQTISSLKQQTTKLQADNTLLKEVNEAQVFTIEKYKADKDRMAELLGEIMTDGSIMEDISEEKAEYYKEQISQALSECGYE